MKKVSVFMTINYYKNVFFFMSRVVDGPHIAHTCSHNISFSLSCAFSLATVGNAANLPFLNDYLSRFEELNLALAHCYTKPCFFYHCQTLLTRLYSSLAC